VNSAWGDFLMWMGALAIGMLLGAVAVIVTLTRGGVGLC
jgi:hypothetical protein